MAHPQLAVSAAIFRNDTVLLVRRAREPAKGLHTLPGGRVEFGEPLHDAVQREVREETGLTIDIVGMCGWREILPRSDGNQPGHFVILPFAALWCAGEPALNDELDDAAWISPAELDRFQTTDGLAGIVAAARQMIG